MSFSKNGFTLIELVVVIIILAVLAVVAAPRFLTINEDAREAMLRGIAAEYQTAVNFSHQKWAIIGGSNQALNNLPGYAGGELDMNDVGFPLGIDKNEPMGRPYNIGQGNAGCVSLFDTLLDSSLTATNTANQRDFHDFFTAREENFVIEAGGLAYSKCYYIYTKDGYRRNPSRAKHVIWYDSRTGDVSYILNN
ncbi:type II secretion system protein [Vibrio rarus]|uniref:type II secretion system protein n=1 Tax=Vibrio rarus TaxID=413403 RepID=UPI0021C328A3|nr:type II secretion system protein [Vibrio rarus]